MFFARISTALVLCYALHAGAVETTLHFDGVPLGKTGDDYICATMDWWPPDKCDYYWCAWSEAPYGGNPSIPRQDINQALFRAAVKELSPFTLRLGGSLEDYITYAIDDNDPCPPLVANASVQFKFSGGCLTKQRWSELAHLCKDAGCRVVFGLNQLVGRTHVADKKWTGSWDSSNTEKLLRYTYDSGLEVYGFELGNELGGWNGIAAQLTPQETAEDFLRLSHLLHDIWGPSHKTVPKLIGPDNTLDEEWFRVFLSSVGPALDAVTIHLYALGPGKDMSLPSKILDPRHDALAIETAANLSRMVGSAGPEMWMGEDGGAYNSGQNGTTNRFISAFWSLTELGTFARAGFSVYCRQTLLGGNYGLIDKDTLKPNPDFFAFLLFKRLMGPRALEVKTDSGDPYLKVFAHCSRPVAGGAKGGVALLLINFHPSEDVRIGNIGTRNILHSGPRQEYLMTSPGLVNGTVAYLNGKPLVLTEQGEYPVLQAVTRSAGGLVQQRSGPMSYPPPNSYSSYPPPPGSAGATSQAYPNYGAPPPPGPQAQPRQQYPYQSSASAAYPQPGSQPYQSGPPTSAPSSLPYPGQASPGYGGTARPPYHTASPPVSQTTAPPPPQTSSLARPPFPGGVPSYTPGPPTSTQPLNGGYGSSSTAPPPPPSFSKASTPGPYPGSYGGAPPAPAPAPPMYAPPSSSSTAAPPMYPYTSPASSSSSVPPPPHSGSMAMPPPPTGTGPTPGHMGMPPPPPSSTASHGTPASPYQPYGAAPASTPMQGGYPGSTAYAGTGGMPPPPPAYGGTSGYPQPPTGAGYDPRLAGMPGQGPPRAAPTSSTNRVDPSQIPRPIEGQELVTYRTVGNGDKAPPGVSRPFVAIDDGNCSPRFLRATTYYVPQTREAAGLAKLPLSLICRPMALPVEGEEEVPLVDYGDMGPVRCNRCKAYINVFVTFLDHGAKYSCNICGLINEVPQAYQCGIDQYGKRRDAMMRPEFSRGSVEFKVGKEYCVRPPQQPIYVFAVDVSPAAVSSGMMRAALDAISESIDHLPGGDKARMGVVTFSSKVQFYRLSVNGEGPSVILLGDVDDPFSALPPDRWVIGDKERFRELLLQIPDLASASGVREESASVATIEAAADALETIGGRILLFTSSRPTKGAGALRLRTDPRDYGTDREKALYTPIDPNKGKDDRALFDHYHKLADVSANRQISIEMFVCSEPGEFVDAAMLGKLTNATAGSLHLYSGPVASPANHNKFRQDVRRALTKRVANETVLKVRTSIGLSLKRYLAAGTERVPGELEMSVMDADKTFVAEFVHDGERIKDNDRAYFQLALLYSTPDGTRVVRVHNLSLPVTSQVSTIFRYADLEAVFTHITKAAALQAFTDPLVTVREAVTQQCVEALFQYRLTCASSSPPGQLILPESLKLMPLYSLALLKSDALRLNPPEAGRAHGTPDPTGDERAVALYYLLSAPEYDTIQLLYPRLYQVMGLPPQATGGPVELKRIQNPSAEFLSLTDVFVLDCYTTLYLYTGREVPAETLRELFGLDGVPANSHTAGFSPSLDDGGDAAQSLSAAVDEQLRKNRSVYAPLVVVLGGSGSNTEGHFTRLLVDDRTKQDASYVEYLCAVHKQIQTKLSK